MSRAAPLPVRFVRGESRRYPAEMLTRAFSDLCADEPASDPRAIRREPGRRWWSDAVNEAALERCRERLQAAGARWAAPRPGEALEAAWPHAAPPGRRR